jgi:hypothetical protein
VREGYTEGTLDALFLPLGFERVHTDWFLTRKTKESNIRAAARRGRGIPTLMLSSPRELFDDSQGRRSKEPYGLLGLYRKVES